MQDMLFADAGGVLDLLGEPNGMPSRNGFVVCERGILCPRNDALGFANGMKYLVEAGTREKKDVTRRARLFVENRFSEGRLLKDMEKLYLELVEKARGKNY